MNDLTLSWKKIARGLAKVRKAANDRAPTLEELRQLVEYPDRRIKPIIHTMASSGIRIGAWDYLKWKHITQLTNQNGEVIAVNMPILLRIIQLLQPRILITFFKAYPIRIPTKKPPTHRSCI